MRYSILLNDPFGLAADTTTLPEVEVVEYIPKPKPSPANTFGPATAQTIPGSSGVGGTPQENTPSQATAWYETGAGKVFSDCLCELNKYNPLANAVNGLHGLFTGEDWERGAPMSKGESVFTIATAIPIFKGGQVINVIGSTGRVVANNLVEQIAMQEIMSNPRLGRVIMTELKDSRWTGWSKLEYVHRGQDGVNTVIHYVGKFEEGVLKFVDDFDLNKYDDQMHK